MLFAELVMGAHVSHAREGGGGNWWRQRCCENETRCEAAHRINKPGRCRYVSSHAAKGLSERPFDYREPVALSIALAHPAAVSAIEADGMHLIEISHGAIFVGEVTNRGNWRNIAVHRVHAFERNQLRSPHPRRAQQLLKMGQVIVAEYAALAPGLANALDHRSVIKDVREDDTTRQKPR